MKLLKYIQGKRNGKEANRLEKEAMKDPFLADAMDGYQQTTGEHIRRIQELNSWVTTHTKKSRKPYAITWSIAACILLGIGISWYFILLKKEATNNNFIVQKTDILADTLQTIKKDITMPSLTNILHNRQEKNEHHTDTTKEITRKKNISHIHSSEEVSLRTFPKSLPSSPVKPKNISSPVQNYISVKRERQVDVLQSPLGQRAQPDSQQQIIRGKITDNKGIPLVGVNITYTGNKEGGQISDLNGEFSIPESDRPDSLNFNYVGFEKLTIPIESNKPMLITMNECDESILDKVVITGTGSSKKVTITGAVSTVSIEDLKKSLKEETDSIPQPIIGMKRYKKYLKNNMIHPINEKGEKIKGEVIVTFTISSQGEPENITISKSLGLQANEEAIRLVKDGPKWTPGKRPVILKIPF